MPIRFFTLLVSAILISGCVNSYNVSKKQPFRDYVGHAVPLQRPALIVDSDNMLTGKGTGVASVFYARYGLIDLDATNLGWGPILGKLPAGHFVTIDSVRDEAWGDSGQITAYGHTAIPPSTNAVSFAYHWGIYPDVSRAPWEPDGTPMTRTMSK